jgi:hypothetical protein
MSLEYGVESDMKDVNLPEARLSRLLQRNLAPRHPRPEFVRSLRERLARLPSMPVLIEKPRHWARSAGLALLGLIGVIASAFAAALVALRFLGWVLTSLGLASKSPQPPHAPDRTAKG